MRKIFERGKWEANDDERNGKFREIHLQNGGGCDQKPVSVHTILASPTSKCPSVQLNVTSDPTECFRCTLSACPEWPSMRPFNGTIGCVH